jgi:hypothetical protein
MTLPRYPLSTRDIANLSKYQMPKKEEHLIKTIFPGFKDHLNIGVSSPRTPKSGGEPYSESRTDRYANKAWPASACISVSQGYLYYTVINEALYLSYPAVL